MPISLLIVDDSDLIRTSLRSLLGSVAGITSTVRPARWARRLIGGVT